MSQAPAGPVQPGLALERTFLAWSRWALALAALGGVAVKAGVDRRPHAVGYAVAATTIAGAGAAGVWARSLYIRRGRELARGAPVGRQGAIRMTTGVAVLVSVAACALALLPG